MQVYIGTGTLSVIFVFDDAEVRLARYRELQSDAADELLVGHVGVAVVADELVERRELDVFEVERRRRAFHVEVLYAGQVPAPAAAATHPGIAE